MTTVEVDYIRLCEPCCLPSDTPWILGTIEGATDSCHRCGVPMGVYVVHPNAQDPNLVGDGPVECSTCLDLDYYARFIWDTNGYYHELGVDPRATRLELRRAYQALGGQESERLTYIIKQLLDDNIRRTYDATPLGMFFYDNYIEEMHRIFKAETVAEYRARGEAIPDWLVEEMDLDNLDPDASPETILDNAEDEEETASHPTRNVWGWRWAYYVWRTRQDDLWRLARWQEHLISALGHRKESIKIAVGFCGGDLTQPWEVEVVGYRIVVFLHQDESPTEALAEAAASRVVDIQRAIDVVTRTELTGRRT